MANCYICIFEPGGRTALHFLVVVVVLAAGLFTLVLLVDHPHSMQDSELNYDDAEQASSQPHQKPFGDVQLMHCMVLGSTYPSRHVVSSLISIKPGGFVIKADLPEDGHMEDWPSDQIWSKYTAANTFRG